MKMARTTLLQHFCYLIWIWSIFLQLHESTATNCTQLPQAIAPEKCCDFPRLFKQNAIDYCSPSVDKGTQCWYDCIYAATEICRRRQCDVRKANDYVDWVNLENTDFIPVYKQAYRECINEVTQLDNKRFAEKKCDPQPELIEICVHNKMFTLCPDKYYHSDIEACTREREFIQNCIKSN